MEVEVKLRLASKEAHAKVAELVAAGAGKTYYQENYFFDGSNKELSSNRVVLRLRFYNTDEKALVTIKGKSVLVDGIGRSTEVEAPVDPVAARSYLTNPAPLLEAVPLVKQAIAEQLGVKELVSLGGFKNVRKEFAWEGHTLELDETQFEWGTVYELECESTEPEVLRSKLEALLGGNGVAYSYSTTTKFANFRNKTLL